MCSAHVVTYPHGTSVTAKKKQQHIVQKVFHTCKYNLKKETVELPDTMVKKREMVVGTVHDQATLCRRSDAKDETCL